MRVPEPGKRRGASFAISDTGAGHEVRAWWDEWEQGWGWMAHRSFLADLSAAEAADCRAQLTAGGWEDVS